MTNYDVIQVKFLLRQSIAASFTLTASPENGKWSDILTYIVQDSRRASEVILRLRSFLEKGEVHRSSLDINEAIREIVTLLGSEVTGRSVHVSLELTSDLPPVIGDRIQLQQVAMNLILNACDAMMDMEPGSRKLIVEVCADQPERVTVAVQDSGPGLDEKNTERIFEPFYTTRSEGMGLSISLSIIEAHGGHLWAVNNLNQGATFYFTIPIDIGGEA